MNRILRIALVILAGMSVLALAGCIEADRLLDGDVNRVKNGYLKFDKSITVGQALDGYRYFKKTEWNAVTTEQGQKVIDFTAVFDMENSDIEARLVSARKLYDCKVFKNLKMTIRFVLEGDSSFKVASIRLFGDPGNGTPQRENSNLTADEILVDIYRNEPLNSIAFAYK